MLRFDQGDARFNFRSVAVIIHDNHVLLHKNQGDDFWALPGGRVELFEHSDATLQRELLEEIGAHSTIERHLWYVESFFEHADRKYHEIANYFLVKLTDPSEFPKAESFKGIETEIDLIFKWFALDDISQLGIKPRFLQSGLLTLPKEAKYLKVDEIS